MKRMNVLLAVLVSLFTSQFFVMPVTADEPTIRSFEDWVLVCEERGNALPCDVRHRVVDELSQSQVLSFSIAYSPEHGQHALQLTLPLDFLLPPGVGLAVGEYEVDGIPVTRCEPIGCIIEALLEQVAIDAFNAGETGYIFLTARDGKRIGLPFSLKGFTKAEKELR